MSEITNEDSDLPCGTKQQIYLLRQFCLLCQTYLSDLLLLMQQSYLCLPDLNYGSKPPKLYGTYTWNIKKFPEIRNPEIRSNVFEAGGHNWYMLVYPQGQGSDVLNHLSLFLCVANHDKLLPCWSRFAQFTITVMNKDTRKSKHSDTLHRFWRKEHDWGWKKFIELTKLREGFIDDYDSLTIKAQVQVIRENVDRPFPCFDDGSTYRRELAQIYSANVKQFFLRFMNEKRSKLIGDKTRWTSLCDFWLGMDQNSRREMSREKMNVILKLVVKYFFIQKEVTSTLVIDFLLHGLKSLEEKASKERAIHTISKQVSKLVIDDLESLENRLKCLDDETKKERTINAKEIPAVSVEKDMFVLVDDAMLLMEEAVLDPSPDEAVPVNRMEIDDVGERNEKLLIDLARRALEVFVLDHIFYNKIEVAYKEAIALKLQEELIRDDDNNNKRRTKKSTKNR